MSILELLALLSFSLLMLPLASFLLLLSFRYVKLYLLPDEKKLTKRKTKAAKQTIDPSFRSTLTVGIAHVFSHVYANMSLCACARACVRACVRTCVCAGMYRCCIIGYVEYSNFSCLHNVWVQLLSDDR